jgi:alkanesulfonate monooxygenase SsuD/methylene tetrahydromethanopterin reductase-like flavin-dependent oxidoreductase (luciferase family)
MLTWIAAATSRIRIATRVLGVPYRPPAMVAKMAESLDRLSGGRLILGLGGGYSDAEFRAFGLTVPSPRDKVDGLQEAVESSGACGPGRASPSTGACTAQPARISSPSRATTSRSGWAPSATARWA